MSNTARELMERKQYLAGIDLLASTLEPREAIWWGCLCLQHASGGELSEPEQTACRIAVYWVAQESEWLRAQAKHAADSAGAATAAGSIALAVQQTKAGGGFTTGKAVANAVKFACVRGNPAKVVDTQRLYLELGMGVAEGRFLAPVMQQKAAVA